MTISGKSLELFFIDGRPDGMLTAEVFNWTGHVLRAPRTQLKNALTRKESSYTGVYVLIGETENGPAIYIGEAEELDVRLRQHAAAKDFWDSVVIITTSANNLHKAHIKYLGSRLIEIATTVGAVTIQKGNQPTRSSLTEASQSNMEAFLETLLMVLPAIRIDFFLDKKRVSAQALTPVIAPSVVSPIFTCQIARVGLMATAILRDGEMIVQAGSGARPEWVGAPSHTYARLHAELVMSGVIALDGGKAMFTADYAFASPSAAAAVVSGRATNGRTNWVLTSTGQTYAEWEAADLAKSQVST